MLDEHWEELEADFARFYQCSSLADALWGDDPMSVRHLLNLITWLPEDSAMSRSSNGGFSPQLMMAGEILRRVHVPVAAEDSEPLSMPWDQEPVVHTISAREFAMEMLKEG